MLNMTSQRWLTDADFAPHSPSKSLWWHYLVVIVPNAVQWTRNASLYITGGGNDNPSDLPKAGDEDIVVAGTLAMANQIICGCLFQVCILIASFVDAPFVQLLVSETHDSAPSALCLTSSHSFGKFHGDLASLFFFRCTHYLHSVSVSRPRDDRFPINTLFSPKIPNNKLAVRML